MAKTWILDTGTKGTGAHVVPLDEEPKDNPEPLRVSRKPRPAPTEKRAKPRVEKRSTPLPAGHVRKKSTGEIGRVEGVDAKAGTVTVTWLRQGTTSTVPLSSVSRK
jgi:hypothetical protein